LAANLVSPYYDKARIDAQVAEGKHRWLVGSNWARFGLLQFGFLLKRGLKPEHRLLDIGCGAFRGGVHFVKYLEPGHYFGVDISQSLLDAGYTQEIEPAGLAARLPRANLACNADFDFPWDVPFDYALAQSLFTHLPLTLIHYCLYRLSAKMAPGGQFYASYYPVPDGEDAMQPRVNKELTTYPARDPYHYGFADLAHACAELPWRIERIADEEWGHPRQRIVRFERI
jgi:SAM-dependent methyltransferase